MHQRCRLGITKQSTAKIWYLSTWNLVLRHIKPLEAHSVAGAPSPRPGAMFSLGMETCLQHMGLFSNVWKPKITREWSHRTGKKTRKYTSINSKMFLKPTGRACWFLASTNVVSLWVRGAEMLWSRLSSAATASHPQQDAGAGDFCCSGVAQGLETWCKGKFCHFFFCHLALH